LAQAARFAAVAKTITAGMASVRTILSTNIGTTSAGGGTGTTGGNMVGMSVTPAGTLMPTNFRLKGGTDEQGKKEIKDIALDKTTRRLLGKEADRIEAELNLRRRAFYQEQDQQLMSMTNRTFAVVQSMTSLAGEVGASLTAVGADTMQPVNIDASVDERGMAIAVRRGESQIRSQQVVFT
jgi:ribosomal protein S6E (S10)